MPTLIEIKGQRSKLISDAQALVNAGKANSDEYRNLIKKVDDETIRIDLLSQIEERIGTPAASVPAPVATACCSSSRIPRTASCQTELSLEGLPTRRIRRTDQGTPRHSVKHVEWISTDSYRIPIRIPERSFEVLRTPFAARPHPV